LDETAAWLRRASPAADLDDLAARLVEVAARRARVVLDERRDVAAAGLVAGVGADVRVEGVELVGREQRVARDLERDGRFGRLGGLGVGARRSGRRGRRGGRRVGLCGVGRAADEQCHGCRSDEREAGRTGSGEVGRARHVRNPINRAG
jgi:hypothetical protein